MKKENIKGITLISLIITIIILLILVGVVINLALGENGIFKLAETAVEKQTILAIKEKVEVDILEISTRENGSRRKINKRTGINRNRRKRNI